MKADLICSQVSNEFFISPGGARVHFASCALRQLYCKGTNAGAAAIDEYCLARFQLCDSEYRMVCRQTCPSKSGCFDRRNVCRPKNDIIDRNKSIRGKGSLAVAKAVEGRDQPKHFIPDAVR